MLFSFLNVSKAAELKIRMKKSRTDHVTKRTSKVLAAERVKRYENARSVEDVVAEVVGDCVEAVCTNASNKVVCAPANGEVEFKTNPVLCTKRKHKWKTWIKRGLAIFMLLHPQIFKGNAEDASKKLGVARSTHSVSFNESEKDSCSQMV